MINSRGFSLLELSIVLVIIGLIAGGIVAGASMIRAAEVRAIMTDSERYKTAVNVFRDKYLGLPGDLKNATAFWGAADTSGTGGECGAALTDTGTGTQTCNGDGNSQISGVSSWSEVWRAWQHLANAELVAGSFTGTQGASGASYIDVGINGPESSINGVGYAIQWHTTENVNILRIGGGEGVDETFFTGAEAWSMDKKLDDGKPLTGSVFTYNNTLRPNCSSTDDPATSEYQLDNDVLGCNMFVDM